MIHRKIIFITGATAGFGKAIAYKFAAHGWDIILNGRRRDRLSRIEQDLIEQFGIRVMSLPFDVRNRVEVMNAIQNLPHDWKSIDVLVNNAGLASGLSTIQEGDIDDWEVMIDTNIKGLLYVSRMVMPLMIQKKQGLIINMSSIAGKEAYSRGNVYCATKHAVDALTKSMRIDLLEHGIKVTSIDPGAAETEFSLVRFRGDAERAKKAYSGYTPLHAEDIADIAYFAATRPPHVVLNDIVVTPLAQANTSYIHKNQME
ncbi:MAG: SDR family NAD(P)-dependent oxidoreductase [Bacteroidetes bacterium]|nr:MAG: SDR family NAD(P)-dependent oxidoreductase [Bacteroidota bacterium]REK06527.1 MAG: SDR family NAD(P)-dependent oxidoreductase [Bacteroidota bacterium]REK33293.1 MAG: SDR family NAD(P)-dependent oxidoreductase [Bacteroidota bacterium]REK49693.1 MAG: SDR family NAD(P)-dependent oxidoreductase [Bacteroidota bacterium]